MCSEVPGLEVLDISTGCWVQIELELLQQRKGRGVAEERYVEAVVFTGEYLEISTKHVYRACVHRVTQTSYRFDTDSPLNDVSDMIPPAVALASCNVSKELAALVECATLPTPPSFTSTPGVSDSSAVLTRYSCPLLIRANPHAIFQADAPQYRHNIGGEGNVNVSEDIPATTSTTLTPLEGNQEPAGETKTPLLQKEHANLEELLAILPDLNGISMKVIRMMLDKKREKCRLYHEQLQEEEARLDPSTGGVCQKKKWVLSAFPIDYMKEEV